MARAEDLKVDEATIDELRKWYKIARGAEWRQFEDVRFHFGDADQVGEVIVFNIRHNQYRLITCIDYRSKRIFVKALVTHKQYMRKGWMKWA